MKKSLVALAVLGSFVGTATAASSVTLYGKVDIAYQKTTGTGLIQHGGGETGGGESRLGIKVHEDLGNGMSAFAHMEAGFDGPTGQKNGDFFNEKSVVGLGFANGTHKLYFGRSASPIDRIGFSKDHRSSGLGWKSSAGNWQNSAFYDYSANGLSVAAAVATKSGFDGNANEGQPGTKASYGLSVKYEAPVWAIAAAYQRDNGAVTSEWGVGGKVTFSPVTLAASYADAKLAGGGKERRLHATLSAKVTANDEVWVNYLNDRVKNNYTATHYGLGYVHSLSKRTEIFANVGRNKVKAHALLGGGSVSATGWDIGMRHSF